MRPPHQNFKISKYQWESPTDFPLEILWESIPTPKALIKPTVPTVHLPLKLSPFQFHSYLGWNITVILEERIFKISPILLTKYLEWDYWTLFYKGLISFETEELFLEYKWKDIAVLTKCE